MQKEFRDWMKARDLDEKTIATQLSQAGRIERHFGDLDAAFDADHFARIRSSLEYSKEDERAGRINPAPFSIEGDLYSNLASYRTTLNHYAAFRDFDRSPTAAETEPEEKTEPGDAPPVDLYEFRLKELMALVKERGYVTYDEIYEALPPDRMSAEQIEDAMSAFSEMGIKVVEKEDAQDSGSASVGRGPQLFIRVSALEAMRDAFLARFPDFAEKGFEANEGGYWDAERAYKQTLIDGAARIMGQADLRPPQAGAALLDLLKDCNLLGWREWRRLDEIENVSLIPSALGAMIATEDPAEGVGRFVALVAEEYLKGRQGNMPYADLRSIPTTVLALARPAEAIAVRYTTMHRAGVSLTGRSLLKNAPMTAQEYRVVLILAHRIANIMRKDWGWRPRDLWDVQGFLWVVTQQSEAEAEGKLDEITLEASAEAPQDDRYRTQADDPARIDSLERGPFAAVLAARIVEIRGSPRSDDDQAFMVHLHGPWGSGKSSILNLIEAELKQPKEGKPSLVVLFNAWKHQRMRPPWWALMTAIYHGAIRKRDKSADERGHWGERFALWRLWWSWRWKAELFPILLVAAMVTGLTFALLGTGMGSTVEALTKVGAAAIVVLAAIYTYARLMIFGSQKAVQTYADLTTDPYRRIVDLFNRLVAKIALTRPLVVFIDDLDRCDSDYVVELLEGIQTLFRRAPVTYVVAADRKWICASFEKRYGDFAGSIGEPCRPLGYLFLDKLFQISAEMPRLTREIQASYLAALLRVESPQATTIDPAVMAAAEKQVSGISNEADLQQLLADAEAEEVPAEEEQESLERQRALRAAAAMQITSAEAARETEHRLEKFSHLLEPNPRSMKRLVNAVGMAQARGILEGRTASPETRARWAMLSLRWPVLAEFIADHPDAISHWKKPAKAAARRTKPDPRWPQAVQTLHGNAAVMETVGGDTDEGALTRDSLAPLLA